MHQVDATGRELQFGHGMHDGEPAVFVDVFSANATRSVVTLWFDATTLDELVSAAHCVLREATVLARSPSRAASGGVFDRSARLSRGDGRAEAYPDTNRS